MKRLEKLEFEKLNANSMQKVYGGLAGPDDDWDTGCSTAPDCCTGDNCADSEPMDQDFVVNPVFGGFVPGRITTSFSK